MTRKAIHSFVLGIILMAGLAVAVQKIPDFRLPNLHNKTVAYHEIRGEIATVIDFWATWCKPCARSIPRLNELYKKYHEQGIQVIGINVDGPRNRAKVLPYVRSRGILYTILRDENREVMSRLKVSALPTILVVNAQNEVVLFQQGYRPGDEKLVKAKIKELLAQSHSDEP